MSKTYFLVAGGRDVDGYSVDTVDIFASCDGVITRESQADIVLKTAAHSTGSASKGGFALFVGGARTFFDETTQRNRTVRLDTVNIFQNDNGVLVNRNDIELVLDTAISAMEVNAVAAKPQIIATGGSKGSSYSSQVYVFDIDEQNNTVNMQTVDPNLALDVGRGTCGRTSVGNYTFWAGGNAKDQDMQSYREDSIEVFKTNPDLTVEKVQVDLHLTSPVSAPAGAALGDFALFAGGTLGPDELGHYHDVDTIDIYRVDGDTITKDETQNIKLSIPRRGMAAFSFGDYVAFSGGTNGAYRTNMVDIFKLVGERFEPVAFYPSLNDKINAPAYCQSADLALIAGGLGQATASAQLTFFSFNF